MNNFKFLSFILASCLSSHAYSALPPLYQTLNEYRTLLTSKEITEKLTSADVIEDIKRDSKGFTIKTNKHILEVDVIYEPQSMIGPVSYHLVFHDAQSIEEK